MATGYPKEIDYNLRISFLINDFLDIRMMYMPCEPNLSISMNRKSESKFDIVRKSSSTNPKLVGAAVNTMGYSLLRNTNNDYNFKKEKQICDLILSKRGYEKGSLSKVLEKIKTKISKPRENIERTKRYSGKIVYDKSSKIHTILMKMIKGSELPCTLEMPILCGNKKTKEYIFTKTKFFKKLKKMGDENIN